MFKKENKYSFAKGLPSKYLKTEYFSLRYQKSKDEKCHCAIVVSKKIDKRSTIRNRLKRKFIHALKEELKNKKISYDLVFYLKIQLLNKDNKQMKEEIKKTLDNIKML